MFRWPAIAMFTLVGLVFVTDNLGLLSLQWRTDFTSDACLGAGVLGVLYSLTVGRTVQSKARDAEQRCICCGYDLRATPKRCPECGTEVGEDAHRGPV